MPRLSKEVSIHLEKARDSAFLAVETYNRPRTAFRSGAYIVLMCIAWTALFHSIFFKRKIQPFYRQKKHKGRYEILDGDRKAWELATCINEYWGADHPAVRSNLSFFVRLRNKIEHRSMPALDIRIFGECQALLFNFEDVMAEHFGEKFVLNESLSLALQFSTNRHEQQERSIRKLHLHVAKDISAYIDSFRTSLSTEQLQDARFSYKIFLIPKPASNQGSSDLAVEFVKFDPNNAEEMSRLERAVALIKPVAAPPGQTNGTLALNANENALPVRLTTNPNAFEVRAFNPDNTHPHRQMDLILRLRTLLPEGTRITSHDLLSVRTAYRITERPEFYYKGKFGSAQYSDAYAEWLAQSFATTPTFFEEARGQYRDTRA